MTNPSPGACEDCDYVNGHHCDACLRAVSPPADPVMGWIVIAMLLGLLYGVYDTWLRS